MGSQTCFPVGVRVGIARPIPEVCMASPNVFPNFGIAGSTLELAPHTPEFEVCWAVASEPS